MAKALLVAIALCVGFVVLCAAVWFQARGELATFPLMFTATSQPASDRSESPGWKRPMGMFLCMLIGIMAGRLHRAWREKPAAANASATASLASGDLYAPLVASPLVYAVVYAITRDQSDMVIASLLAFENGFFCDTVLARRVAKMESNGPSNGAVGS